MFVVPYTHTEVPKYWNCTADGKWYPVPGRTEVYTMQEGHTIFAGGISGLEKTIYEWILDHPVKPREKDICDMILEESE